MLLIFDGWGLRDNGPGNAIDEAQPRRYQELMASHPWIPIEASGELVGLPPGQIGNSEVGHTIMGAGRILYQAIMRINKAIETGDFFKNPVFTEAVAKVKENGHTLHLMGLVGPGGVHSHQDHLLALIDLAKKQGVEKLNVHAFLDGRDVPPKSAEDALRQIEERLLEYDYPQIQTVSGRYYAMDRDKRWDRVQKAYDNLTQATGTKHMLSIKALEYGYKTDVTDEFIEPSVTDLTFEGIRDGDAILFFNFRPDRARQLTAAFTQPGFDGFERGVVYQDLYFGCMAEYDEKYNLPVAYPREIPENILAQLVSKSGKKQFRCAETEKYAHVTYFFNGGREEPFPGEDHKLIPSPRVATYDEQPEMNLPKVADAVVEAIESDKYDFFVVNFANPDMVGHTGKKDAAIEAVKAVDEALGRVVDTLMAKDGVLLLTADHGNIEMMQEPDGSPHTAHTTNKVPCLLVSKDKLKLKEQDDFGLANIAPTLLDIMGMDIPAEMTGDSMLATRKAPV